MIRSYLCFLIILSFFHCNKPSSESFDIDNVAGNDDVANYMKAFEGRGALSDNTAPTDPNTALKNFEIPEDLLLELVLSEPDINQPLEITFDHKGRMWVVQYNQYPYPKNLKVTGIDNHLRAKFDKIPDPPPLGAQGADKITFFEDTDGDGSFDKSTDAITGLNIATGVEFGRGKIWVLNPPYLLAYPDKQGDGIPDGPPTVHLEGFGLEDTHAVANSLRWGPDGWLYGATGSTVTSTISSSITKSVHFEGQSIWRYHPDTEIFEIFAEGGGNTFHVEIDAKGRIYSGDNGSSRGQYYKQGAYYIKNWGKHGALTNPYAFGNLANMALEGDNMRFTHAWIKYEGAALPSRYQNKMLAINPLLNYLQLTEFEPNGSTFNNIDLERIMQTEDRWFRPVDIKAGPDGAVYLADWYDSRLSHVDPNDTWHKSSGRIYRLTSSTIKPLDSFDISTYSNDELIELLSHPNKWFRQQALRQFGDRKDASVLFSLSEILENKNGQVALEALWALNLSGLFDDKVAITGLTHKDPYVRMWTVRLLGDSGSISKVLFDNLIVLAQKEQTPEVQSQLASTAKRIPAVQAIYLIKGVINNASLLDPDIPLQLWWALESKVSTHTDVVIEMFEDPTVWEAPIVKQVLLERLAQRLIMEGGEANLNSCLNLLALAPPGESTAPILDGIQEGLRGSVLPSDIVTALKPYFENYGNSSLIFQAQQGDNDAIENALLNIQDNAVNIKDRLAYTQLMGELKFPQAVPVLLEIVETSKSRISIRQAALKSLANYEAPEIGERVAKAYPDKLRADSSLRMASLDLFVTRSTWAKSFLMLIEDSKQVSVDDVPIQIVRQFAMLDNKGINQSIARLWPNSAAVTSARKEERMKNIANAVSVKKTMNLAAGEAIYGRLCGSCHQLFGSGGSIGPNLTGYDRNNLNYLILNIVDPNIDIREGYVNYKVVTKDERTLTGTVAGKSSEIVTLRLLSGQEITIPTKQIREIMAQPVSIMPERILDHLTEQELRDLFGYLMKSN